MKIIIGLGNPGTQYVNTRHNIGFLFLDWWKEDSGYTNDFHMESKFQAEILETQWNGEKILFVKPQTYMNLSGQSVLKLMSFYKLSLDDIFIIYDDISMDFGKIRFREKGSAGGQNGVKSIIAHIGENFKRIKIGIGYNPKWELSDWVLSSFSDEEYKKLQEKIFKESKDLLLQNF